MADCQPFRPKFLLFLAVVLLQGCVVTPTLERPSGEDVSLVFGHIDMDGAPSGLGRVVMKRMRPVTDTPYYHFWIVDGTFFTADVPKGTYKFDSFGGQSGWTGTSFTYRFPEQGKGRMDRRIVKPGIYYVGSYRYKEIATGLLEAGKYDLEPVAQPSEREILEKILPYAQDEYWKSRITKRIKELTK